MNDTRLWVAEYGRISKGSVDRELSNGDLELSPTNFDSVLTLLDESDTNDLGSIFRFLKYKGRDCLQVQNFVGVIRTDGGCQIEIVPKISKSRVRPTDAQDLLIKMIDVLGYAPFERGTIADLHTHKMPLFEMILRYFLDRVSDIVRQGIARAYSDTQDNLVFLRGKLQLTEHLKQNLFQRTRFYCAFDEFEVNRPLNRLIKRALEVVLRKSQDARNIQHCRELLYCFGQVPPSTDVDLDFRSARQDRLVQHYRPAMPTCKLILDGLNPMTQAGKNRTLSMLFDMNVVFQNYVVVKLTEQFPDWRVSAQMKRFHLVSSFQNRPCFQLIPDAEIRHRSRGTTLIADCKWKLIDPKTSDQGISQSDMYQLFAYCKKCMPSQDVRCVILIYPRTEEFHSPHGPFYFDKQSKQRLYALPFDLNDDCLVLPSQGLEDENLLRLVA